MAEAAALAFGAFITPWLQLDSVSFLSDSQLLVEFFNGASHDNPPHWEAKIFTQSSSNHISNRRVQVLKIQRDLNITAHSLAKQAFTLSVNSFTSKGLVNEFTERVKAYLARECAKSLPWQN